MSIEHISCQRLSDGRWQAHVRGKDRGWTCAQQTFDDPIKALHHTIAQYVDLSPRIIDTEDLF